MVMTLITPDSLDLICNDEAALRRVHRSAPFARRSGAVAALAARGAGRDHALADANRGSAAQPLRPPFGTSRRRGAATGHRGRRAIFGRLPTTPPCQCWIPAAPRPDGCGATLSTTVRGRDRLTPPLPTLTVKIVRASIRQPI